MRYLITVSSLTSGSGLTRYIFTLCEILIISGNEVYVLTTHDDSTISYERRKLDTISTTIHLISLGSHGKLRKYIEEIRIIKRIKPDVIINNYNAVTQYILPFISKAIKFIHVLHNDTTDFYRVASINRCKTDGWIAPTEMIAKHFNDYTSNKFSDKVVVIPHGVEETTLIERHNEKLEIVYTGVLYEHKGVKILPPIIRNLLDFGINLHFTIVGGGILEEWLREQFVDEIKNGIVTFTGVIDHDSVYKVMSKTDIFLYPTHLDAFGLVIAEAMMNGMVPVVTNLAGITDNLIDNGKDGYLIEQDDINSFVEIIKSLACDKTILSRVGKAAHDKAKFNLSMKKMKENYIKYLNYCINNQICKYMTKI